MAKIECAFCSSKVEDSRTKFSPDDTSTREYDICEFCFTSVPHWVMSKALPYQKSSDDPVLNTWLAAARVANYQERKILEQAEEFFKGLKD